MSRAARTLVTAVAAMATMAVASCGGQLVDEWPALAEAAVPIPAVGTCSRGSMGNLYTANAGDLTTVASCAELHNSELVHVGTFTGAEADRALQPPLESDAQRRAFAECVAKADEYLGDDYRTGRFVVVAASPPDRQWQAGARYFRCELFGVESEKGYAQPSRGSAKDGLRGARPLGIGCVDTKNPTADGFDDLVPAECLQPHDGEFAGIYRPPAGPYPSDERLEELFDDGCQSVIAKFMGASLSALERVDYYYLTWYPDQYAWVQGDRAGTCYVAPPTGKKLKASVKGWGAKALPT